jgi:hypothetical protein
VTPAALGGVPTAEITIHGSEPRHVVLYFHGGVYVLGDAFQAADLASQVGRGTGPSRTAPVGPSRQRRTRHRLLKRQNARCPYCPTGRGLKSRPATRKYQVKDLIAGNGRRAFHHPVPAPTPGS